MTRLLALLLVAAACGDDLAAADPDGAGAPAGELGPLLIMTYNVQNQGEGPRGETIAAHIARRAPTLAALQEMGQPDALMALLPARYRLTEPPHAGIALLYDAERWRLTDQGAIALGFNDDGWGSREAVWGRFAALDDGAAIVVYSTHWCQSRRTTEDRCDAARHLDYSMKILDHVDQVTADGTPAIVAGDLNVWDGFEEGPAIRHMVGSGLVDVFRHLHPDDPGWTIPTDLAAHPDARIDYIFSTAPVDVREAWVDRDAVPEGQGSDHYAVLASLEPGAPSRLTR